MIQIVINIAIKGDSNDLLDYDRITEASESRYTEDGVDERATEI